MTVIQISTDALTSVIRRKITDAFVDLARPDVEPSQLFVDVLVEDIAASIVERATAITTEQPKDRETVWCEAHGPAAHFERTDCVHPRLTDQATRARLNAEPEAERRQRLGDPMGLGVEPEKAFDEPPAVEWTQPNK